MAVTDLTDGLPWWARQGPGATGGPAAAPQGAGGPPGAGNSASWLQYLSQMFGISPAQAATLSQNGGPNPANMPSPDASNMALQIIDNTADHGTGDNPPVSPFVVPPANPPAPAGPSILPQKRGVAVQPGPMANGAQQPGPGNMPARPAGVSASGLPLQPGALSPGALSQFASAAGGPIGSGGYVPWPSGGGSMSPTAPPPAGQTAPGGPLATGGATGQGATSNPRFVPIDRPNMSAAGGFGRGGSPQMTALNLAGLFGGGQPAAPSARVAGPLASGGATIPRSYPGEGWDIDAQGNPIPSYGSPLADPTQMNPGQLASAVSKPNWWQRFGRPDMNPGQLASAVKKPNWYRNV